MSAWRVIAMVSSTICCRQGATMETKSATDLKLELATRRACLLLPADTPEKRRLDRRVTKGTACMPYPGAYALAEPYNKLNPRAKARMTLKAIHALHPNWTFCSFSAAVAHGLQVPGRYLPPFRLRSRQRRAAAKSQGTLHATPITADLASSPMECSAPAFCRRCSIAYAQPGFAMAWQSSIRRCTTI